MSEATAKATHTPGPWGVERLDNMGAWSISRPGNTGPNVAGVFDRKSGTLEQQEAARADAHLIAAAPDLLAACKAAAKYLNANRPKGGVSKVYDQLVSHEHEAYRPLLDAIAKAEGQS